MIHNSANQSARRRWMPPELSPAPGYALLRTSFTVSLVLSMLLVVVIGDTISFGAREHDLEGSVQRESDGRYRYHAAKRTTGVEIPEDLNVGYEQDFYAPHGAYWEGESDQEVYDRANTGNGYQEVSTDGGINKEKEAGADDSGSSLLSSSSVSNAEPALQTPNRKSKSTDPKYPKASKEKLAYKSRDGDILGGAAGRYSNR